MILFFRSNVSEKIVLCEYIDKQIWLPTYDVTAHSSLGYLPSAEIAHLANKHVLSGRHWTCSLTSFRRAGPWKVPHNGLFDLQNESVQRINNTKNSVY